MALDELARWTDRWVDELMDSIERDLALWQAPWTRRRRKRVYPRVNLSEKDDRLILRAFVPGVMRENLDVTVENDHVRLAGERPEVGAERWDRHERPSGSFHRTIHLPVEVDAERAEAELRDGVLTLQLPKSPKALPKKIEVKSA